MKVTELIGNMKALAKATDMTWDGGLDDTRLHAETIHVDVSAMSEAEYEEMEESIGEFEIQGHGFTLYAWNDSSGYEYWKADDGDSNYIQLTASIDADTELNPEELKIAVANGTERFAKYDRSRQ